MIIDNIHIIEFPDIYRQIINRKNLEYCYYRLLPTEIEVLKKECTSIIGSIHRQLPINSIILNLSHNSLVWGQTVESNIVFHTEYTYTLSSYEKALYRDRRHYALWNGVDITTKGCISNRRDIALICKDLFIYRVRGLLTGSTNEFNYDSYTLDDYLFKYNKQIPRVLNSLGKLTYDIPGSMNDLDREAYNKYVSNHIKRLF